MLRRNGRVYRGPSVSSPHHRPVTRCCRNRTPFSAPSIAYLDII